MVGQGSLKPSIMVRIHAGQHNWILTEALLNARKMLFG